MQLTHVRIFNLCALPLTQIALRTARSCRRAVPGCAVVAAAPFSKQHRSAIPLLFQPATARTPAAATAARNPTAAATAAAATAATAHKPTAAAIDPRKQQRR